VISSRVHRGIVRSTDRAKQLRKSQPAGGSVRALERGLALLELVNETGGIKPADAGRALKLPRPTAHRLLETLEELGYVRRSASDNRFVVTIRTHRLSGGYDTDVRLSEAVGPVLSRLLQELVWPINIATYRNGKMVVRETTHPRSPLSVDRAMLGREVPVLRTASGKAHLSFCPEAQRLEIIETLRMQAQPEDLEYLESGALERMLLTVRRNGYATRLGGPYVPITSSISVPIMVNGQVAACVTVIWNTTAMAASRAIRLFTPQLRRAAAEIAQKISRAGLII
jgi:IclR family transcriptional regulator, mhp operon transcriptional activator